MSGLNLTDPVNTLEKQNMNLFVENKRLKAENEALLYSLRKLLHHALDEHYLAHDPDGYVKQADDLVDKIMSER